MPSALARANEAGVVVPSWRRSALVDAMLWTRPDTLNPSTSGQNVTHSIAKLSRSPVPIQPKIARSTSTYRVVGKPRSIWESEGCGQRVVITLALE